MKVITKLVNIMDEEFALITDKHNDTKYYGTIPYSELDDNMCLVRQLNGHDMAISLESVEQAIYNRECQIKIDRYKAEGHSKVEVMMFIIHDYSTENWDMKKFEELNTLLNKGE